MEAVHALMRRSLLAAALCLACAMQAGCAISLVNAGREDAGHPIAELGEMKRPLQGVVFERTDVDGSPYVRVALPDARKSCERPESLELLLPLSDQAQYPAILRESTITPAVAAATVPVYGTISSRPPGLPSTGSLPKDEEFTQWLTGFDVASRSISPIVIGYDKRMGIKAFYRLGGTDARARVTPIEVKSDWVCRSRVEHGLMVFLYAPAVVFDVFTFPLQAVLLLLTAH